MTYRRSSTLTPMMLRAINYHMRGYSKEESMRKAGYAEASARGNHEHFWGTESVKAEIRERMRKLAVKTDITLEKLLTILSELLVVAPSDLIGEDGKQLEAHEIPPHVAKALNWRVVGGKVRFETIDKIRIIELIAKLTGLSQETINIKAEGNLAERLVAARKRVTPIPLTYDTTTPIIDGYGSDNS